MANVRDIRQNAGREEVTLELGGRKRAIKFDLNAFAELESRFGTVEEAMQNLGKGRMSDVRYILWVGLIHDEVKGFDPDTGEPTGYNITPYDVGSWITPDLMPKVSEMLAKALGFDMPDPQNLAGATTELSKNVPLPEGHELAQVELTDEEKKAAEEEAKNG